MVCFNVCSTFFCVEMYLAKLSFIFYLSCVSSSLLPACSFHHRRLAETRGDFAEAADMEDFESKKPKLARMIIEGM